MPKNSNAATTQNTTKTTPSRRAKPSKAVRSLRKQLYRIDEIEAAAREVFPDFQAKPTPTTPSKDIALRSSASVFGVATLELTCFDCTELDIEANRDEIMQSIIAVVASARAKVDGSRYKPQRRAIESFTCFMQPVCFGVLVDVLAVDDGEILASADEIMAGLIASFKRVGNAPQGWRHG